MAVASRDRARAEAFAKVWEIPQAVDGYQRLLDDPSIDAIYIPLPNSEHVRWTLASIAARKHALCEKPLALDPAHVDQIVAAATAAKICVEEGFTFTRTAENDVRLAPALGGGALWDVGCYPVTYARLIADRDPKMVFGSAHWTAGGVDEEFIGMLRFPGGTTATIYAGFIAASRTWLEVLGSDGALTVPNPFRPGPLETLELERAGKVERIDVPGSPEIFVREVEDFEACVLDGAPPVVSLAESRRTAAILSTRYASARDTAALYPHS